MRNVPIPVLMTEELFRIGDKAVSLYTLASMLVTFAAMLILSWLVRLAMQHALRRGKSEIGRATRGAADRLVHYGFIVVGLTLAMHLAGIKLGAVFAAGAVFAVGFGFAMQNIAQNFVSGIILLVERTIKPGDVLEISGSIVKVMKMSIRATIVRTLDDEDIIVPNSTLVQSNVKNYTLEDNLYRVKVTVGVSYDSDLRQVRDVLEKTTADIPWRDKNFPPRVLLMDFGASSVDFETSAWMHEPFNYRIASSELREAIWWAFKRAGITIAFPQVDVHLPPALASSLGLSSSGYRRP